MQFIKSNVDRNLYYPPEGSRWISSFQTFQKNKCRFHEWETFHTFNYLKYPISENQCSRINCWIGNNWWRHWWFRNMGWWSTRWSSSLYSIHVHFLFHISLIRLHYSTKLQVDELRVSYPIVFIYYCPPSNITLNTLYASTKSRLTAALAMNLVWFFFF